MLIGGGLISKEAECIPKYLYFFVSKLMGLYLDGLTGGGGWRGLPGDWMGGLYLAFYRKFSYNYFIEINSNYSWQSCTLEGCQ